MKRSLPILIAFFTLFSVFTPSTFAQAAPTPTSLPSPTPGPWVKDPEVTFIGKNASRSGSLLDWTLSDYGWSKVTPGKQNPLISFWITIRNIVYSILVLFVLATAFVLIATRGKSVNARRFFPRFIAVILLVTFSFALVELLYGVVDVVQGFFLRSKPNSFCPPDCISQKDLLYISWKYPGFEGWRLAGEQNVESAFINLLFVKLTAFTYYVIVILMLLRKIILWFLIVLSPIFPLLLLYYPVRNTAKIWIGEFFRWLLYAPLFAILLSGLVALWRTAMPLLNISYILGHPSQIVYPTATNILLGGPGQTIGIYNSANRTDTFALYLLSLMMLWGVILLPFILLQVFLDHLQNFNPQNNALAKFMVNFMSKFPPSPLKSPPSSYQPTGFSQALPFMRNILMPSGPRSGGLAKQIPRPEKTVRPFKGPVMISQHQEVANLTNIPIPTLRDIARYDSAHRSTDRFVKREVSTLRERLEKIAVPTQISASADRDRYIEIREMIVEKSQLGNLVAANVLAAASAVAQASSTSEAKAKGESFRDVLREMSNTMSIRDVRKREQVQRVKETLIKESQKANPLAVSVLQAVNAIEKASAFASEKTSVFHDVLKELSHPEKVSEIYKEQIVSLKETLMKESNVGDSFASTVLSTIEKLSNEKISEKEKSESLVTLSERITKETEKGNPLATTLSTLLMKRTEQEELLTFLEHLANPPQTATKEEKEQYVSLRDRLVLEREQNVLAETIYKVIEHIKESLRTSETLQRIVNPELVSATSEKALYVSLHDQLTKEKDTNTLSSHIFTTVEKLRDRNVSTSEKEQLIETIRQELVTEKEKGNPLATAIIERVGTISATSVDEKTIDNLQKELTKAAQSRSPLASTLLAATRMAQEGKAPDIAKVQEQIAHAKSRGDMLGVALADLIEEKQKETLKQTTPAIPTVNRIQQVSIDDYEAVRKMWIENYQNLEEGTPQKRRAVIQDDINQITDTINLLTSVDNNDQAEGMQKVSDVLPFLLIGGFSQDEIIAYLKAKQEAARTVLLQLTEKVKEEEETLIDVTRKTEASKVMAVSREDELSLPTTEVKGTGDERGIVSYPEVVQKQTIMQLTDLTIPTMRDIAEYERRILVNDLDIKQKLNEMNKTLQLIASPSISETFREHYQRVKEELQKESDRGNSLAKTILNASSTVTRNDTTAQLPKINRVQPVSLEDYEEVKKMWVDSYQSLTVPLGMPGITDRESWIRDDIKKINDTIEQLSSSDAQKVQEGMRHVSDILPFLLIGGFSQDEIIAYLKAKQEAAKTVLESLETVSFEDEKVTVDRKMTKLQKPLLVQELPEQTLKMPLKTQQVAPVGSGTVGKSPLHDLARLPLPTMRDIATFEQHTLSKTEKQDQTLRAITETLKKIVNPQVSSDSSDRLYYSNVKETLEKKSAQGDQAASLILQAAKTTSGQGVLSPQDLMHLTSILKEVMHPDTRIQPPENQELFSKLRKELLKGQEEQNELAVTLSALLSEREEAEEPDDTAKLERILAHIINQQDLATFDERSRFMKLAESIATEEKRGNDMAYITLAVARSIAQATLMGDDRKTIMSLLLTSLEQNAKEGDPLASLLLQQVEKENATQDAVRGFKTVLTKVNTPSLIHSPEERIAYEQIKNQIIHEADRGHILARKMLEITDTTPSEVLQYFKKQLLLEEQVNPNFQLSAFASLAKEVAKEEEKEKRQEQALVTVLTNIADPDVIKEGQARQEYDHVRTSFIKEQEKGNKEASQILSLATSVKTNTLSHDSSSYITSLLKERLIIEKEKRNPLATLLLGTLPISSSKVDFDKLQKQLVAGAAKGDPLSSLLLALLARRKKVGTTANTIPQVNRTQPVSLDDYEAVKRMWIEAYEHLDVPQVPGEEGQRTRKEWIEDDIKEITQTINLLLAQNPADVEKGMKQVSDILPFLLIGGFSKDEIIAYLKAKLEACKIVLEKVNNQQELVEASQKPQEPAEKAMAFEIPDQDAKKAD